MDLKGSLIGISAVAGAGKDTVFSLMAKEFQRNGYNPMRFAFADRLKKNIDPFLTSHLGIGAFTRIDYEKDIIRPILVAYGETMRGAVEDYWVDVVEEQVVLFKEQHDKRDAKMMAIVTDVRYENEAQRLKNLGGKILHIERDGVEAPNESEERNTPLVKVMADSVLAWPTFKDEEEINSKGLEIVKGMVKELIDD